MPPVTPTENNNNKNNNSKTLETDNFCSLHMQLRQFVAYIKQIVTTTFVSLIENNKNSNLSVEKDIFVFYTGNCIQVWCLPLTKVAALYETIFISHISNSSWKC